MPGERSDDVGPPPDPEGFPPPDVPADGFPPPDPAPASETEAAAPARRGWGRAQIIAVVTTAVAAVALVVYLLAGSGAGGPEITTSAGSLTIEAVEFTDQWPPGCGEVAVGCGRAAPGFRVLVVWLDGGGGDRDALSDAVIDAGLEEPKAYVTDAGGNRTDAFAGGVVDERLVIAFTPAETSTGFTLHWPDNDPIELDV